MDEYEALALAAAAKKKKADQPKGYDDMGFWGKMYENYIGSGPIDSPGERLGAKISDVFQSAESGARSGIAAIADIPQNVLSLGGKVSEAALNKAGANPELSAAVNDSLNYLPTARGTANALTGNSLDYQPKTTAGEYARTVGEFLPAAAMPGGQVVAHALVPGVMSEAAGQLTEGKKIPEQVPLVGGMDAEPIARTAAALAGPGVYELGRKVVTPNPTDPARIAAAQRLEREGVQTTAGQKTGNKWLQYREEGSRRTADIMDNQDGQFTTAALRRIDAMDPERNLAPADRATPEVLQRAKRVIGGQFDDVADEVSFVPSRGVIGQLDDAAKNYEQLTNKSQIAPVIRNTFEKIKNAAESGRSITGQEYTSWRSQLSEASVGGDTQLANAAKQYINILDDAAEAALDAAGKPEVVSMFARARKNWQDYLSIRDATARAGEDAAVGVVNPRQLRSTVASGKSRAGYAEGRRELGDLVRDGNAVMSQPRSSGTAERLMSNQLINGMQTGGGGGALAFGLTQDPQIASIVGALSAIAPSAANKAIGTPAAQRYLANQLLRDQVPALSPQISAQIAAQLLQGQAK